MLGVNGYGCGYNLFGIVVFVVVVVVKGWLQQYGDSGILCFYGCFGEEGGLGKIFMVCEGLFDDVDVVLIWYLEVWVGMFSICIFVNIQVVW